MRHSPVIATALMLILGSCSGSETGTVTTTHDLGTGLNTVDRKYVRPADAVWNAAVATVKSYNLQIDSDRHDDLGGEIVARRADGHQVTFTMSALDQGHTDVSIRVAPGNRDLARMLQERLADQLGMGEAKASLLGGNSAEGTYGCDVGGAVAAAERTCRALDFVVTRQELRSPGAQLDARTQDSTPVRFTMIPVDHRPDSTQVTFIAGNGRTDENRDLVSRMKMEFEHQATLGAH